MTYPNDITNSIAKAIYRKLRKTRFPAVLWNSIYRMYPKTINEGA